MSKPRLNNVRVIIYMKTGRKFVHFTNTDIFDESDAVKAMRSKVFGLETDNKGFASYRSKDIERIELREV